MAKYLSMVEARARPALVLVATPIGNLGDLGSRAIDELRNADSVACEDTRRTGALFAHFGIAHDPFIVCNDHTEAHAGVEIVRRVEAGQRVAFVSDAGSPAISDPGYRAVRAAIDADIAIEIVPGPSAVIAAVSVSGFATDRFCFEGFLPRKGGERSRRLQLVAGDERTTVLFESPRRLAATIDELIVACGGTRRVMIARELTKTYEEFWRGTLDGAAVYLASEQMRGELVIVLEGAEDEELDDAEITGMLLELLTEGTSARDAVRSVVERTGAPKRRVYALANELT